MRSPSSAGRRLSAPRVREGSSPLDAMHVGQAILGCQAQCRQPTARPASPSRQRSFSPFEHLNCGHGGCFTSRPRPPANQDLAGEHPDPDEIAIRDVDGGRIGTVLAERPKLLGERPPIDRHDRRAAIHHRGQVYGGGSSPSARPGAPNRRPRSFSRATAPGSPWGPMFRNDTGPRYGRVHVQAPPSMARAQKAAAAGRRCPRTEAPRSLGAGRSGRARRAGQRALAPPAPQPRGTPREIADLRSCRPRARDTVLGRPAGVGRTWFPFARTHRGVAYAAVVMSAIAAARVRCIVLQVSHRSHPGTGR
jgi:hypothetical protein